jgi:predicted RNA-binding Zn ribbon-like protein
MTKKHAAQGELELVRAFVNTLDIETGRDNLENAPGLREWLTAHGLRLGAEEPTGADLWRALAVREALRALLVANSGKEVGPGAAQTLNEAARRAGLSVRFGPGEVRLEPSAGGVDGAIGRILAAAAAAMANGSWRRLKACREEACRWAFYDHTRNLSGVWCSMAVCGNRRKVRRFRQRHAT